MASVLTEEKDKEERKERRKKDWGLNLRCGGGKEQEAPKKITVEGHRHILYGEREQASDRIGVERWLSYPRTSPELDTKTGLADTSMGGSQKLRVRSFCPVNQHDSSDNKHHNSCMTPKAKIRAL